MAHASRWSFVIDTDEYAGTFDDEISAFVTGERREGGRISARELRPWRRAAGAAGLEGLFEERAIDYGGDKSWRAFAEVYPTPGWSRSRGRVDLDHPPRYHRVTRARPFFAPAYFSVRLFLSRKPTVRELAAVKARVEAWTPSELIARFLAPKVVRVTGCRVLEEGVLSERRV